MGKNIKAKKYKDKYIYTHITPNEFEITNPNVSLPVIDENNNVVYASNNNRSNKAKIVKTNNHRYAAIQPPKNKFIKLEEFLESFSHAELTEYFSGTNLDQGMKNDLLTLCKLIKDTKKINSHIAMYTFYFNKIYALKFQFNNVIRIIKSKII